MNEMCWFCNQRMSDPSAIRVVTMQRVTSMGRKWEKTETMKIQIPRCRQCASVLKKQNAMKIVVTLVALLLGFIGYWLVAETISDTLACFSGPAVGFIFIVLYSLWNNKQRKKISAEQSQILRNATRNVREHPKVKVWLEKGWSVLGSAAEMEM